MYDKYFSKYKSRILAGAAALLTLLVMTGCQNTDSPADSDEESGAGTVSVPVTFIITSASTAAPGAASLTGESAEKARRVPAVDNMRDLHADHVQVNLYRRPEGTYADDREGFVFDSKMTLACREAAPGDRDVVRYAFDNVRLEKGYEYRATAFGYSDENNELALISLPGPGDFSDARVTLTDDSQYTAPELFFGTVRDEDDPEGVRGSEIFAARKGLVLTGYLYRCVAGVGLSLTDIPEDVTEITLLSGSVHTESEATDYDDFLTPGGKMDVTPELVAVKYRLAEWVRPENAEGTAQIDLRDASLLPVTSRLSVRFVKEGIPHVVTLRMKRHGAPSGEDPALTDGLLEFRRNYYYRISGDFEHLATQNLFLTLRVNPDWEADIDLSLGDK